MGALGAEEELPLTVWDSIAGHMLHDAHLYVTHAEFNKIIGAVSESVLNLAETKEN